MFQFLKAPYLVLDFLMNTSIYVVFSTISVIKHLIWQQLDQQDTLDWDRKGLLISMLQKLSLSCLTGPIILVLLMSGPTLLAATWTC